MFPLKSSGQVLLLDEMVREIMSILIALSVSHPPHQVSYRVTQVEWHRLISALSYIFLDSRISLVQGVAFRSSGQINHGLS